MAGASFLLNLSALAALVPATIAAFRRDASRDAVFWLVTGVAVAGPAAWTVAQFAGHWRSGLAATLWMTVAVGMVLFAALSAGARDGWRLSPLLLPYLLVLGTVATALAPVPGRPFGADVPAVWVDLHILFAVLAYSLAMLAAIAAAAVFVQERALKAKRRTRLTGLLPSVAGAEGLQVGLLIAAECVLALGILSGMATEYTARGRILAFDHKTVFAGGAFVVIAVLLVLHFWTGMRGRQAARLVLVAYLFLTLGYLGVKFVSDVLQA